MPESFGLALFVIPFIMSGVSGIVDIIFRQPESKNGVLSIEQSAFGFQLLDGLFVDGFDAD